jgi:hypothetical protein
MRVQPTPTRISGACSTAACKTAATPAATEFRRRCGKPADAANDVVGRPRPGLRQCARELQCCGNPSRDATTRAEKSTVTTTVTTKG